MTRYLHVEGVNFGQTLFDTSDISTIRGASRACEDIVAQFRDQIGEEDVLACGASKLIAKTSKTLEDLATGLPENLKRIYRHLSFAQGAGASLSEAETKLRLFQLQNWTVPEALSGSLPCALSKTQPGVRELRKGPEDVDSPRMISQSVFDRRGHGMKHRHNVAKSTELPPAPDFEMLVKMSATDVPLSARNKMAVVHADGAGFGAALAKLQAAKGAEEGLRVFSSRAQAMQTTIIKNAVTWAAGWSRNVLQFEVLLAGGDDLMFVLPAWRLLDFLGRFHDWTVRETIEGSSVHFRLGAIIADRKSPVRQMTGLAFEAVDALRASGLEGSLFSIDVFESAAPPMDGLSEHRKRLYGARYSDALQAWPLDHADALAKTLRGLRAGGEGALPRSQIYRALRGLGDLEAGSETVRTRLDSYRERTGRVSGLSLPGVNASYSALNLAWAGQLWDYCGEAA